MTFGTAHTRNVSGCMEKSASEIVSGSSALTAAYQLYILKQQGVDEVLEGLTLSTASPECLPLLHARADVDLQASLTIGPAQADLS